MVKSALEGNKDNATTLYDINLSHNKMGKV